MKRKQLGRHALILVLLAVSLFSVTPARADQIQVQVGTVVFHLTGQANSMNSTVGALGSAALDLSGGIHGDGQGGLVMQNMTGNLQIGSANYTISKGDGSSNRLGEFAIFGQSNSGELVLHGIIQNNITVTTNAPPSRLSSIAYLALSGSIALNISANSSVMIESSQNATSTVENRTSTSSSVNSTQQYAFSSSNANFTSQSAISTENATQNTSNVTTSLSQTASYALPGQSNAAITTTQFNNQTITVYEKTVANGTVTQTTTTTVTDTTTQFSSASNTTVVVTNSTTS